jgi:hypothetical protein
MQSAALTIFGWLAGIVAVVAFVAGPTAAVHIAGNGLGTIGITAGALAGGVGDMVSGFELARTAAAKPSQFDRKVPGGSGGRGGAKKASTRTTAQGGR